MRLRQPPVERTVTFVQRAHPTRIHFVFLAQQERVFLFVRRLRVDQFFEVRPFAAEDVHHLEGPGHFVIEVSVVEVLAHLELEQPFEIGVKQGLFGIVTERFVAQQFHAALHPAPAIAVIAELDRDVEGHVPRLNLPDGDNVRFQFRDPIRELDHFEILAFVLKLRGADPQRVRNESAKTSEHLRRKGEHGRRILQWLDARDAERGALAVEHREQESIHREQCGGQGEQQNLFGARVHSGIMSACSPPPVRAV